MVDLKYLEENFVVKKVKISNVLITKNLDFNKRDYFPVAVTEHEKYNLLTLEGDFVGEFTTNEELESLLERWMKKQ